MHQSNCDYNDSCSNIIYQTVDVDLPISFTPVVDVGEVKIECCRKPNVAFRQTNCSNGSWEIVISQTITYKIPVQYSIKGNKGEVRAKIDKNQTANNDKHCY